MSLPRIMTGEKVRLARPTVDDIPTFLTWFEDENFSRHIDTRPPYVENKKTLTDFIEDSEKSNTLYAFNVRTIAENTPVGLCALEGIQWTQGTCWLMIGIGNEFQGKGYGHETMRLLVKFGFEELNLHRIQLTVFEYNEYAITLYEKIGFRREGVFREAIHRNNRRYDIYLYGLLRREWSDSKPRPQV